MDIDTSRVSRKLTYAEPKTSQEVVLGLGSGVDEPSKGISLDEIRNTFKNEIDELVGVQLKKAQADLGKKFQEKFDLETKKHLLKIDSEVKNLKDKAENLSELIGSLTAEHELLVSQEVVRMDGVLVEIVMESLFKILGQNKTYQKSVEDTVSMLTKKLLTNLNVSLKVSEGTYHFLASIYENNTIMNSINKDNSLSEGQLVLDDGVSITEVGLLDQLDVLKSAFIAQLRDNHAL